MSSLELLDLLQETDQVTDWFILGLYLKIPRVNLTDIEKRFSSHGVQRCKAEMFEVWMRNTPDACWEQVLFALEKCGESVLADKIGVRQLPSITNDNQAGSTMITNDNQSAGSLGRQNSPKPIAKAVRIKLKKKLVKRFTRLERDFANLVSDLITALQDKKVDLEKLQSYLETRLEENGKFTQAATINELFRLISPHYCFLNTVILEDLVEKFVGEPLKKQLEEYENHLDEFTESTELSLLKEVRSCCPSGVDMPQVVFKLTGFWPSVTIKHFKRFVDQIFGAESSALTHIRVKDGCICVSWFTRKSVLSSLIALAQYKVEFMRCAGVMRLSIGDTVILERDACDVDEDIDLQSALLHATITNCKEAVEFFLFLGADPDCAFDGTTPLIFACTNQYVDIVRLLLCANANVNLQDENTWTALMVMCDLENPDEKLVEMIIQSGADLNMHITVDIEIQETALMLAVENGNSNIVKCLLDEGAFVDGVNDKGVTALKITCRYGNSEIMRILLDYGADPNFQDDIHYTTALHVACHYQFTELVDILLLYDADPNLQDINGDTALILACDHSECPRDPSIPVMLLSADANSSIKNESGKTAIMTAAMSGYEEGIEAMLNVGNDLQDYRQAVQDSATAGDLHGYECMPACMMSKQTPN